MRSAFSAIALGAALLALQPTATAWDACGLLQRLRPASRKVARTHRRAPARSGLHAAAHATRRTPRVHRVRTSRARTAVRATKHVRRHRLPGRSGLRAAARVLRRSRPGRGLIRIVGLARKVAGPVGTACSVFSTVEAFKAARAEPCVDTMLELGHCSAWAGQAVAQEATPWVSRLAPVASGVGLVGGTLRTGLGLRQVVRGVRQQDREQAILGCLDVGSGLCWAAVSAGVGGPAAGGALLTLTLSHFAYGHRRAIRDGVRRGVRRARDRGRRIKRALRRRLGWSNAAPEGVMAGTLSPGDPSPRHFCPSLMDTSRRVTRHLATSVPVAPLPVFPRPSQRRP
jgi:hypothetical protein